VLPAPSTHRRHCFHAPPCSQHAGWPAARPQVLEAVSDREWRRLHDNMKVHHRAFVWDSEYGGLAYNYTIISLRRRLHNLNAGVMQEY
jgi:hypothetical protein